jgi:hypothetical protein
VDRLGEGERYETIPRDNNRLYRTCFYTTKGEQMAKPKKKKMQKDRKLSEYIITSELIDDGSVFIRAERCTTNEEGDWKTEFLSADVHNTPGDVLRTNPEEAILDLLGKYVWPDKEVTETRRLTVSVRVRD